eukprot:TRINITY_DN11552_c0_g1_i1.p1 TRINITY_DN11552_c0_g1~~TRINITY_DN11552_c0_g1_i1.p1  ORF type:complete len:151 (-),score=36.65 TRINITY_DN11552_c0_g1_i1:127-579(-)
MIKDQNLEGNTLPSGKGKKRVASSSLEKRGYIKVPDKKRRQLIRLLQEEQLTIKAAAVQLDIHYSAAKCIVKIFRQEKRVTALTKGAKVVEELKAMDADIEKKSASDNEAETLVKTPELVSVNPINFKEEGVRFDFGVYSAMINARYRPF